MGDYVYILKCADGTLYTGAAKEPQKRAEVHNSGKGARYTRCRLPVELVYSESCSDWPAALRREIEIKKLTRRQKEHLISPAHKPARPEKTP